MRFNRKYYLGQAPVVIAISVILSANCAAWAQTAAAKARFADMPQSGSSEKTDRSTVSESASIEILQSLREPEGLAVDDQKIEPLSTKTDLRFAIPEDKTATETKPAGARTPTGAKLLESTAVEPKPIEAAKTEIKSPEPKSAATNREMTSKPEEPNKSNSDLVPIADAEEIGIAPLEAASFKGVTPGATTAVEIEREWGQPKEINKQNGALVHLYAVDRFDRVEVSFSEDKVTSVIIRFPKSMAADAIAQQLELTNVRPVFISNENGQILGQSYPERGVLFAFEPNAETPAKPSMKVAHIILEPITAEPFVLRAETHIDSNTKTTLLDLEQALKLQPENARALWLYSRALMSAGESEKALVAGAKAVSLEPDNAKYRVTRAQIMGQAGRVADAIQEARKAMDIAKDRPHVLARAQCLMGDLLASGQKPDYKQAVKYHMDAVKTAEPLTSDKHPAIRLAAKEVFLDAHLGAAHDIAWGEWKDKEAAVSKWLGRATVLADELVKTESGTEDLRFHAYTRALAASVGLRNGVDPAEWTKQTVRYGDELIEATKDPLRKAQIQSDLGAALYDALQVFQMRGDHDLAMKYGKQAIEYLEQSEKLKPSSASPYLLGRLYFRLGAIQAIRDKNHLEAVKWFDKAAPLLEKPLPKDSLADIGRHGETFVSMGVSYWEVGQREKAVRMTQQGVTLMEQAVKQSMFAESALAIPYSNLATMHRQLGADDDAARFQKMAAKARNSKVQ
jgi:tetratricopeptide (TPR) repeat protein